MALLGKEPILRRSYSNYYKRFQQLAKKPQAKISGLISLTIFTVAFFGMFAILPTFKTIARLNKEIEDAESVNIKLAQKIKALDVVEELYAGTIKELKVVSEVLPEEAFFERLAWQIHWLAADKNLQISSGSFGEFFVIGEKIESDKEPLKLSIEVVVGGTYGQIKEFVEDLIKIDRLVTINEVSINSKKYKNVVGKIAATIKLTAHYLPSMNKLTTDSQTTNPLINPKGEK